MSLPVVAIVVASVSATFTGISMLISTLTYRRGGARLKVYASRLPLSPFHAIETGDESFLEPVIHVHVINRSASAVTVDRVEVDPFRRIPKWVQRLFIGNVIIPHQHGPHFLSFVEGSEKKKIPPFEGALWSLREVRDIPRFPRRFRWLKAKNVRVAVILTNGETFRSGTVTNWRTNMYARAINSAFRWRNELREWRHYQLSFDDALKDESD
ncbi:hypothetical protein ACIQB5_08425 [Streptomyces sp. NPDC088560]|uniref:hypothetical protein n=1 Tax=Streptomyces sp. NPDC088560 TaxID=3365868 RepID=UPI0037FD676A